MSCSQLRNHELSLEPLIFLPAAKQVHPSLMAAVTRMTRDLAQERASKLANEAIDLANDGQVEVSTLPMTPLSCQADQTLPFLECISQTPGGCHPRPR